MLGRPSFGRLAPVHLACCLRRMMLVEVALELTVYCKLVPWRQLILKVKSLSHLSYSHIPILNIAVDDISFLCSNLGRRLFILVLASGCFFRGMIPAHRK